MITRKKILELFKKLNGELSRRGEVGEVGIVGGAVMCLVYNAREATRDIDAVFKPAGVIRAIVEKIAFEEGISPDWLNDAAKGFISGDFARQDVLSLSNLKVWCPEPRYMLAMKCISARWDTSDKDDVIFLIEHLGITSKEAVLSLIEGYYPRERIPAKTQFFIEELFDG